MPPILLSKLSLSQFFKHNIRKVDTKLYYSTKFEISTTNRTYFKKECVKNLFLSMHCDKGFQVSTEK